VRFRELFIKNSYAENLILKSVHYSRSYTDFTERYYRLPMNYRR